MKIIQKEEAPQYVRDGIRSFLLVAESTIGAQKITTTLVEMEPGGIQKPHNHENEQCYMVIEGSGVMEVDGVKATICSGETVFIPTNSVHSLENTGETTLRYISAASPTFGKENEQELWPLSQSI